MLTAEPTGLSAPPSPRRSAPSHAPEADALLGEVRAAVATLSELFGHENGIGPQAASALRVAVQQVESHLARRELRVALVGEAGSGKSTFIDALLGERLLGTVTTNPATVVTVRRATERAYVARFTDGSVEAFASRIPDPTRKLRQQLAAAETAAADAQRRADGVMAEVVAAADAERDAETYANTAFRNFEVAREEADRLGRDLGQSEKSCAELSEEADSKKKALPLVVRERAPWWAFWLWLARWFVLLFASRSVREYRRLSRAKRDAHTELESRRAEVGRAADRCTEAEARLASAGEPLERARKAIAAAKRVRKGAESRREELDKEVARRRDELERAEAHRCAQFAAEVRALSDEAERGRHVVSLEIEFPARLLPADVVLIDAAGATADDAGMRERAWHAIAEQADGCIVVSELEHAVNTKVQKFLEQIRAAVPHATLVLTKLDESIAWAETRGVGDPWDEVDRARRIGTRRFAREVHRDPDAVFSIAVAAEEALRSSDTSTDARRRFEEDAEKVFAVLRRERALILGARSAGILRRCMAQAEPAQEDAKRTYEESIATLEARRIPGPDRFHAEQMHATEPAIRAAVGKIITATKQAVRDGATLVRVDCAQQIDRAETKDEVRAIGPALSETIARGIAATKTSAESEFESVAEAAVRELERTVFSALRERYHLLHEIGSSSRSPCKFELTLRDAADPVVLAPAIDGATRFHDRMRVGFGVGGAAAGATAGTLILPGLGTAAGAAAGALLTFARTLGALRRSAIAVSDETVGILEAELAAQIEAAEPKLYDTMVTRLAQSLDLAIARFVRWIAEPLEAERETIDRERAKLRELEQIRARLRQHDARLSFLMAAAADASVGLCS